uniref:Uncharacterized protein n=1 Tax=Caldilinea aerophila TaxID=133453 RepID=A0A7C1JRW1_9CHLR
MIPVALDLVLWMAPRFSVARMAGELAQWYRAMSTVEGIPPDAALLTQQVADAIELFGNNFNLLSAVVSTSLLHVPSLLVGGTHSSPLPAIEVETPGEALVFWLLFSLMGLLVGVIYLGLLARRLPIGALAGASVRALAGRMIQHWLQIIAFIALVALLFLAIYLPLSVGIGFLSLFSPALGSFLAMASGAFSLIIFFYLYFATAAIVMDNLSAPVAMKRSVSIVHHHFFPTLGFIALSTLIGLGISLLLLELSSLALWAVAPAIVLNAYVGTGLAMALLIFYRTRYLASDAELFR